MVAIDVDICNEHGIRYAHYWQPFACLRKEALAVVQVEFVYLVIFAYNHNVRVSIPVQVPDAHILAVVVGLWQSLNTYVGEMSQSIVQQENIRAIFVGNDHIEVAVAIHVHRPCIHAKALKVGCGQMGISDVDKKCPISTLCCFYRRGYGCKLAMTTCT